MSGQLGTPPSSRVKTIATALIVCVLVVVTIVALGEPLLGLTDPISRNYNEGWNAFRAAAAMQGEDLYPAPDATVFNNYPPLSFYIVGVVGTWVGDFVVGGRVIALLGLVVVVLAIGCIASTLTASRSRGGLASLLALASFATWFPHYVAMNDPQMLGHAFQYVGLAVLVGHGAARTGLLVSMGLLLLGGLVKHVLLPVPLGVGVWLFATRRHDFVVWISGALLCTAAAVVWMALAFGMPAFTGILLHQRALHAHLFALALQNWFVPLVPLLGGAIAVTLFDRHDPRIHLLLAIAGFSVVVTVGVSFGDGVTYNAVFDLVFASIVLLVCTFDQVVRRGIGSHSIAWAGPLFLLVVVANLAFPTPLRLLKLVEATRAHPGRVEVARADIEFVRAFPGPVLCENAALAYWSGKDYEVDFFNYGQRLAIGSDDGHALVARLGAREFDLVQIEREEGSARLNRRINRMLFERYELVRHSPVNGWFFAPRNSGASGRPD